VEASQVDPEKKRNAHYQQIGMINDVNDLKARV